MIAERVSTYGSDETLYALVHEEAFGPTNAFPTGEEAEAVLHEILGEEPEWAAQVDRRQDHGSS